MRFYAGNIADFVLIIHYFPVELPPGNQPILGPSLRSLFQPIKAWLFPKQIAGFRPGPDDTLPKNARRTINHLKDVFPEAELILTEEAVA